MSKTTAPEKNGAATAALPPQFETFNKQNATGRIGSASTPSITISGSGNFRISAALATQLKVKAGGGIAFHFDGTQESWYVERDDKDGFVLRDDKTGALQFNSSTLYHKLHGSLNTDAKAGRMAVSEEVTRVGHRLFYQVITGSLKAGKQRKPRRGNGE
jgi:hypothetical protein